MHEISRRDNYAAASTHRFMRWKKTSATGSPTGTKTPNPSWTNAADEILERLASYLTEFLAQDAGA
jgi:hypothetical protein